MFVLYMMPHLTLQSQMSLWIVLRAAFRNFVYYSSPCKSTQVNHYLHLSIFIEVLLIRLKCAPSWLYRILPGVIHNNMRPIPGNELWISDFGNQVVTPNQIRWKVFREADSHAEVDFVDGIRLDKILLGSQTSPLILG